MSKKLSCVVGVVIFLMGVIGYLITENRRVVVETVFEVVPEFDSKSRSLMIRAYDTQMYDKLNNQIKSEELVRRAIKDYNLVALMGKEKGFLLKKLADNLCVSPARGTNLVSLKVFADTELLAQQISFALTQTFLNESKESRDRRHDDSIIEFEAKRKLQEKKVKRYQAQLAYLSKKDKISYSQIYKDYPQENSEGSGSEGEVSDPVLLGADLERLIETRESYNKELAILDVIKKDEFELRIQPRSLLVDPFIIHKKGWNDEITKKMKFF